MPTTRSRQTWTNCVINDLISFFETRHSRDHYSSPASPARGTQHSTDPRGEKLEDCVQRQQLIIAHLTQAARQHLQQQEMHIWKFANHIRLEWNGLNGLKEEDCRSIDLFFLHFTCLVSAAKNAPSLSFNLSWKFKLSSSWACSICLWSLIAFLDIRRGNDCCSWEQQQSFWLCGALYVTLVVACPISLQRAPAPAAFP